MTAALPLPDRAPLPRRLPADPTDEAERLADWGLLTRVLEGLTADDLEACQGQLLVHADGHTECLQSAGCPTDAALHTGTVRCTVVLEGCCS